MTEQIFGEDPDFQSDDKVSKQPLPKEEEHKPILSDENEFLTGKLLICDKFAVGKGKFKLLFEELDVEDGQLKIPDGVITAFSAPISMMGEAHILSMALEVVDGRIKSVKQNGQFPLSHAILPPGGPGTELKALIKRFVSSRVCGKCARLAVEMDRKGCDWVKNNVEDILDQMEANAKQLKVVFSRSLARRLIGVACWLAKRKDSCGGF